MYKKIMVPIDLAHADKLAPALQTAADLANLYKAEIIYVGITAATPGSIAHNPAEYAQKLAAFAESQSSEHGATATSEAYVSHDPTTDLDNTLLKAIEETGSDLVVMATHIPNLVDSVWPSNGGKIATHSGVSVFLVRH